MISEIKYRLKSHKSINTHQNDYSGKNRKLMLVEKYDWYMHTGKYCFLAVSPKINIHNHHDRSRPLLGGVCKMSVHVQEMKIQHNGNCLCRKLKIFLNMFYQQWGMGTVWSSYEDTLPQQLKSGKKKLPSIHKKHGWIPQI